jgi:hypothetical protein
MEIFPEMLKVAKIRPIFKKGDKQNIKNYRLISLLSNFSKTLEKVMYNRLISYIETFNILLVELHGFRKRKCTETAIQVFVECIQQAFNSNVLQECFWP